MFDFFLCIRLVFFFFFFKQKTAYEIYQCDWSSDVCSSDLWPLQQLILWVRHAGAIPDRAEGVHDGGHRAEDLEIGRASCRERV